MRTDGYEKPGLRKEGIKFCHGGWTILDAKGNLDRATILATAREAKRWDEPICYIQFELYPMRSVWNESVPNLSPEGVKANMQLGHDVVDLAHKEVPGVKVGIYPICPFIEYGRIVGWEGAGDIREWYKQNETLRDLGKKLDFTLPQAYAFFANQDEWEKVAVGMIGEARKYGKPVYLLIAPSFAPGGDEKITGKDVSPEFFARMLRVANREADGVVVFGSVRRETWWMEMRRDAARAVSEARATRRARRAGGSTQP
jgi:hypothetical protein